MKLLPDPHRPILLNFPGLLIVAGLRRDKKSLIYRRSWKMIELHLFAWWFSGMFYLAMINLFLAQHCGPLRTDLLQCPAKQSILNLSENIWPSIVNILDSIFVGSFISSLFVVYLLSTFQSKRT